MVEPLEGVLSEELLDELASDLGIDPKVMRKHPIFRVLKGNILLTYPLRVFKPQFTAYEHSALIAGGASFEVPLGVIVFSATLLVANKLQVLCANVLMLDTPGATLYGHFGTFYANNAGHSIKFKNTDVGEQLLTLQGFIIEFPEE